MSIKKTAAIAAAVAALAAVSVPAMAFENEFHGIYNIKGFVSNYENGGTAAINPLAYGETAKANNFIEQRARLQYTAKASDDLKLVTHFELDTKFGGDKSGKYGVSSDAGVLDADGVMIETKHVYLDFNLGKSVNVKTGIMPVTDALKGTFIDADITGILATTKIDAATIRTGFFRYKTDTSLVTTGPTAATATASNPVNSTQTTALETNTSTIGHNNADLFLVDGKYAINKDLNVGGLYYLNSDYSTATPVTVHVFGVTADAKIAGATVSGFVAAQAGHSGVDSKSISAVAANVAGKLPIGPGTLKTAALYLSGDGDTGNKHITNWQSTTVTTYAEGGMMLLARTGVGGTTNDRTITGTSFGADTYGTILYTLGYDATITPKLYANANAGLLWVAKSNSFNAGKKGCDLVASEINLETGYKVYDNLTAKVQIAYDILGGIYKDQGVGGKTPENPYTGRIGLSYAF